MKQSVIEPTSGSHFAGHRRLTTLFISTPWGDAEANLLTLLICQPTTPTPTLAPAFPAVTFIPKTKDVLLSTTLQHGKHERG